MWSTYVCVESADEAAESVKKAGGTILVEPFDAVPAGRMAVLADPAGAQFCAWEPRDRQGAELVNDAGAWSMSLLNTRDPEGSEAFYGSVFGWETETMELGGGEIAMWRLPGYLGGEPLQPVPRDVVAVMAPVSGDQSPDDTPSQWSVDFWVDDVDATADNAADLGGEVIAAPYDIPGAELRQAVLADPQGAGFSVTKVSAPA
jgi:predicted enzyme related to lactoylglutathione lyase